MGGVLRRMGAATEIPGIKVYIQLDESSIYITGIIFKQLISFVHILFNDICQNRIFAFSKLICPSI